MSAMTYAGVSLGPLILTQTFDEEPIFDESNCDYLYTRYTVGCRCVLSKPFATQYGRAANEAPTTSFVQLRKKLQRPRQVLSYEVNGVELIPPLPTQETGFDATGGPKCKRCKLIQLTDETILADVEYTTDRCLDNPDGAAADLFKGWTGVLSNRWSETATVDEEFRTHLVRQGKLVIAQSRKQSIDSLRESMISTSINPGFRRISSEYTLQTDGCAIAYRIEDIEVFRQPPTGCVLATGDCSLSSPTVGKPYTTADVHIRLVGDKTADQSDLIGLAMLICRQKIVAVAGRATSPHILAAIVKQGMYENFVECTVRAGLVPSNTTKATLVAMDLKALAGSPFRSPPGSLPPDPGSRGTANILLHAAAYHDPFAKMTLDKATNQLTGTGYVPGQ